MKLAERLGIRPIILQWHEPRAATELQWRQKGWPECKNLLPIFGRKGFLSGLLATAAFCLLIPLAGISQMWINSKTQWICCIRENGVGKSYSPLCEWKNITAYNFADHPELVGLRCLIISERDEAEDSEHQFCFDPNEVRETEVREIIEAHLGEAGENEKAE